MSFGFSVLARSKSINYSLANEKVKMYSPQPMKTKNVFSSGVLFIKNSKSIDFDKHIKTIASSDSSRESISPNCSKQDEEM